MLLPGSRSRIRCLPVLIPNFLNSHKALDKNYRYIKSDEYLLTPSYSGYNECDMTYEKQEKETF